MGAYSLLLRGGRLSPMSENAVVHVQFGNVKHGVVSGAYLIVVIQILCTTFPSWLVSFAMKIDVNNMVAQLTNKEITIRAGFTFDGEMCAIDFNFVKAE